MPYRNKYYKVIKQKRKHFLITLSDHFGRCTEMMFNTEIKKKPDNKMEKDSDSDNKQL